MRKKPMWAIISTRAIEVDVIAFSNQLRELLKKYQINELEITPESMHHGYTLKFKLNPLK